VRRWFAWSAEHLEGQFLLLSFLVLGSIGIVLYIAFAGALTRLALTDAAQEVGADNAALSPLFVGLSPDRSLAPDQLAAMDKAVADRGAIRYALVKVWTPDGRVLYSTRHDLIGIRIDPLSDDLENALSGHESGSLANAAEAAANPPEFRHMLEVYTPMRDGAGHVVGAFEVYESSVMLEEQVNGLRRILGAGLGVGLLIMWGVLFSLVRRAGVALRRQNLTRLQLEQRVEDALRGALSALSEAVEAKDAYTSGHVDRVAAYTVSVARHMHVPEDQLREMEYAALLHDVGKLSIPDAILQKPGALTPQEREIMQTHSPKGEHILHRVPSLQTVALYVRHHHERFDGAGYPDGTAGEQIPLGARIIAVVDTYDAITTDRPYRAGRSREEALAELARMSGSQFDPEVIQSFMSLPAELLEEIRAGAIPRGSYTPSPLAESAPGLA
jgi:hypothetical protein